MDSDQCFEAYLTVRDFLASLEERQAKAEQECGRHEVVTADDGAHLNKSLSRGICPDCGSSMLRGGPKGGCSQNVLCETCRAEFNAGIFSERLGPCEPARQKQVYGLEAR
jgi:ssDNA-binding Zn-finger/Zn-ribbon topoisomerase 1